jgi:hypothetical protein
MFESNSQTERAFRVPAPQRNNSRTIASARGPCDENHAVIKKDTTNDHLL